MGKKEEEPIEFVRKTENHNHNYFSGYWLGRALATVAALAAGVACMQITDGKTGIGWAVLAVFFIWAG